MKSLLTKVLIIMMSFAIILTGCTNVFSYDVYAASTYDLTKYDLPDVDLPREGCTFLYPIGNHIYGREKAIKKINSIRKEACDNGYINPATGKKLTSSDYIPLTWNKDLERISQIRSAESQGHGCYLEHERLNGTSIWDCTSNGISSAAECLAIPDSCDATLTGAIDTWYSEKEIYLEDPSSWDAGHYAIMINPDITYWAIAGYGNNDGEGYCTVAAEFQYNNGCGSNPDSEMLPESDRLQLVEVEDDRLDYYSIEYDFDPMELQVRLKTGGIYYHPLVEFKSSDEKNLKIINGSYRRICCSNAYIYAYVDGKKVATEDMSEEHTIITKTIKKPTVLSEGVKRKFCTMCDYDKRYPIAKIKATGKLNYNSKNLVRRKSFNLTVSKLANGDSVQKITKSNNSVKIKKMNSKKYKITGVKKGKAKIVITLKSGKKLTCNVKVK